MPSLVINFAAATNVLAQERGNCKIKPSTIFIDNSGCVDDAQLTFNDIFTPDITNGVPLPVLTTIPRLNVTIPAGVCQSLEDSLKDMEFLGTVSVTRGALNAACLLTFMYDFL
jgi:hypothetical protein